MRATLSVAFLFFLGKNRCETDLCSNKIGGDGYKHHPKIFSAGGFTKWGVNFRISEGVLLRATKSHFWAEGDDRKHHLEKTFGRRVYFRGSKCPDI